MARLLYRLGRGSARHAWAVILAWCAVLAIAVGAVALNGVHLTNAISIPGTETQRLADRLQDELPEANQGTGRVVFHTQDGSAFTESQRAGIAEALHSTESVSGVAGVVDPFETQGKLDDARDQLANGRQQLDQGRQQLERAQQGIEQIRQNAPPGVDPAQIMAAQGVDPQQIERQTRELEQREQQLEDGERTQQRMSDYRTVSEDGSTAIAVVNFDQDQVSIDTQTKNDVMDAIRNHPVDGVAVDFSQEISQDISQLVGPAEVVGVVIAAIVLLIMLRALAPAVLPVLTALTGVAVSTAAAMSLSGRIDMMSVTPMLGVMLGLAVGIDYSLFLINRYRQQLRRGQDVLEAIGMATGTAGTAVFFAALTVIVALVALNVTGIPFLGLMGSVAGAAVLVALLITLTLTPALLRLIGRRALPRAQRKEAPHEESVDTRHVPLHLRHPWLTTLGCVAVLAVLALPAQDMRLGLPDASTESRDSTQYQAYERIADEFGAGENGPLAVVVDMPADQSEAQAHDRLEAISARLSDDEDVSVVLPAATSEDRETGVIQVIPGSGPADERTENLVDRIREYNQDNALARDTHVGVAGPTAANIDVSQLLGEKLPVYLGVVLVISLLLLLMVFRSILVPIFATVGFLLSVLASFGAVVAAYQWGWGGEFLGVHDPGPILSFLPTLMIGILFGLAMDYQLFLVSGMREAYVHGQPARKAVVYGFRSGRSVVTAAAIIMISVFAGFIFADMAMIRPIGFALAVGVLLDAFVVRMFLIPALMRLLGEASWWIPRWLDRILPRVDVEGESLVRASAGGAGTSTAGDDAAASASDPTARDAAAPAGAGVAPAVGAGAVRATTVPDATSGTRPSETQPELAPESELAVRGAEAGEPAASDVRIPSIEEIRELLAVNAPDRATPVAEHRPPLAPVPAGSVLTRTADPLLAAANQALRMRHGILGSEDAVRAALPERTGESAPHRGMHERVSFEKVILAGRPVLVARPVRQRVPAAPVVVYWHGGAFLKGIDTMHWHWLDELIESTGATVVVPSYGLVPQHTVDEGMELADAVLAYAHSLVPEQGEAPGRSTRVIVAGDSAGGGLALAHAQRVVHTGARPADGLILISPWVELSMTHPRIPDYAAHDHMLRVPGLKLAGRWWAGERAVTDPLVSPARGRFDGLPRTLVFQGDRDLLFPDVLDTVAGLQAAGVDVTTVVCEGAPHVYPLLWYTPTAREEMRLTTRWLRGEQAPEAR